jgi:hypothetical protein
MERHSVSPETLAAQGLGEEDPAPGDLGLPQGAKMLVV